MTENRFRAELVAWLRTLVSAAVYATLIVTFGFQAARVDGMSMQPTLQDNDRLIVNKLASILRVANALDAEHLQKVREVRLLLQERGWILDVEGDGDLTMEQLERGFQEAEKIGSSLERLFDGAFGERRYAGVDDYKGLIERVRHSRDTEKREFAAVFEKESR